MPGEVGDVDEVQRPFYVKPSAKNRLVDVRLRGSGNDGPVNPISEDDDLLGGHVLGVVGIVHRIVREVGRSPAAGKYKVGRGSCILPGLVLEAVDDLIHT